MYLLIICLPLFSFLSAAFLSFLFGKRGICFVSTFFLGLSMLISLFIFYEVILCNSTCNVFFSNWFNVGLFYVSWSFYFDGLTAIMCVMITIVSFAVHMFSISYMEKDFQQERFMGLLSIFTFFMLVLVTADNFLQLILGWEGVGICSYLLINFWFMRKNTNDSALKALIFNRVGDLFLLLAMFLVYFYLKTFDFVIIFDSFRMLEFVKFNFLFYDFNLLDIISCFLVIAAIAKSAQIFLSGWLMDAMEGPTPVSALIHAATMVTAGIYLVVRFSTLITNSPTAIFLIVLSGSLTTLLCSLIGIDSFDLKRIIASSTASQLGYMFFVCGLTEYASAICHLFYHAFFKALLFLSAGVIIHSLADEQDIRKMGGLVQKMPLAFIAVSLGSFALIGAPFIGGFYSKDPIIEYSDLLLFTENLLTFFCCTLGAFNTTYYSTRLISLVFLGRYNGPKVVFSRLHDSSLFMYIPLIFLLFFTCLTFLSTDIFLGEANLFWFFEEEDLFFFREGEEDVDTFILTIFFILLGAFGFKNENVFDLNLANFQNFVIGYQSDDFFKFVKNCNFFKWFFDFFFIKFFVNFFYKFSNFLFLNFDRGVFEVFGPLTFVRFFSYVSFLVTRLQTGFIYHYVLFQIINLIFILIYLNDFILESKSFLFVFLIFFGFFRFLVKFDFFTLGLNMVAKGIHRVGPNVNNENLFKTTRRMYSTSNNDNGSLKDEMSHLNNRSNNSKQKFDNKNLSNATDKIKEVGMWGLNVLFSVFFFFFVQFYEVIKFIILVLLRVFIAFPLLVGKFVLEYFFYRPIKFFLTFFFKLVFSIFKFKFFIIGLVIYFFSTFQRNQNQNIPGGPKFVDLSLAPEDLIFVNRAASPIMERVFYINKKFPQLHEIESSFFNLHSPLTFRMQRFFNFFHPLDFRFWFWNLGAGDSEFSFYMPEIWNRDKLETSNFASYFLIKQKFKIHPGKREKHLSNQAILDQDNILLNTSHNFSKSWLAGVVQKYNYVYRGGLGFDLNETIFQNNTVEERKQPTGKELHEDFVVKKSFNIHHMYKTALQKQKGVAKAESSSEKIKDVSFLESGIPERIIFSLHEVIKAKTEQQQTDLDLSLLQEKKETFNQLKPIDPADLEGKRFFVDPDYFIYLDEYNVVRKFQFVSSKNVNKLLNYYNFVKPDVDSLPFEAHTVELLEDYDSSLNLDTDLNTGESSMSVGMPFRQPYISHGLVRGFFNFLSKSLDKNSLVNFNSTLVSSFDLIGDIFSGYVDLFKNFHLIFSIYGINSLSFYSFPTFSFGSDSIMPLKSLSRNDLFGKKQLSHNSSELASMKREKFFLLDTIDKRRLELINLTRSSNSTSFSTVEARRIFDLKQSFIVDFGFSFDDYSSYLEYKRLAFSKTSDIFFSNFQPPLFSPQERALYDEINLHLKTFFIKYENFLEKNRYSEFAANRIELLSLLKKYEMLYGSDFLDNISNIKKSHILLRQFLHGDVDTKSALVEGFFLEMEGFLKRAGFFSDSDLLLISNIYNKNVAEYCSIMNNKRLELFFNSDLVSGSFELDFVQEFGFAFDDIWMAKRIRKDLLLENIEKEIEPESQALAGVETSISSEMVSNFKNLREKLYDAILGDEQTWNQMAAAPSLQQLKHIDRAIIRKKIEDYNNLTGSYYAPAGPNNIIVFEDPDLQEVVHFIRNELDGLLHSYWIKYQKSFFNDQDIETNDPFELKKPKLAIEFFDKYKTITEGFEFEVSKAIANGDEARLQDLTYFFDLFRNRYSPIFDLERQIINSNKRDVSLAFFSKASKFDSFEEMGDLVNNNAISTLSSKNLAKIYHLANISWLDFFPKLARVIKLASLIRLNERNFNGFNSDEELTEEQKFQHKVLISLKEEFFKNCGFHYDVNNLHNLSDYFYDQTKGLFGYISFDSFVDLEKIALRTLTYFEFEDWVFRFFLNDPNFRVFLCMFEEGAFANFVEKGLIGKLLDYLEYSMSIGAIESVIDISRCIRLYGTLFDRSNNFEMDLSNITNLASILVESDNLNLEFTEPVEDITKKKLLRLYGLVEDNAFSDISNRNDLNKNSDVEFLNFYKFLFDHLYKLSEFSTMKAPWLLETSTVFEHSELTKPILFSEFQTRCVDTILSMFLSMAVDSIFIDKFVEQSTLYDKLMLLRDFLTNEKSSMDSRGDVVDLIEGFLHYFEFNFPSVYYFQRDLNDLLNYQSKFSFFHNIMASDYLQSASSMPIKLSNDFSLAKNSFSNLYGFEFEDELKVLECNSADLNKCALFDLEFVDKEIKYNLNLKSFFEHHSFETLDSLDSLIVEWNIHSNYIFNTTKEFFKDYYQLLFGTTYSSGRISSPEVNFGLDESLFKLVEFFSNTDSKKKEELAGTTKQLVYKVKQKSFINFIRLYETCFLTLSNGSRNFSYQQFVADCNSIRLFDEYFLEFKKFVSAWFPELSDAIVSIMESSLFGVKYFFSLKYGFAFDDIDKVSKYKNSFEGESFLDNYDQNLAYNLINQFKSAYFQRYDVKYPNLSTFNSEFSALCVTEREFINKLVQLYNQRYNFLGIKKEIGTENYQEEFFGLDDFEKMKSIPGNEFQTVTNSLKEIFSKLKPIGKNDNYARSDTLFFNTIVSFLNNSKSSSVVTNMNNKFNKIDNLFNELLLFSSRSASNVDISAESADKFLLNYSQLTSLFGTYYPADKRHLFLSNLQMLGTNLKSAFIKNDFQEVKSLLETIRAILKVERWKLSGESNLSQIELEKLFVALEKNFNFVFINKNLITKKDHIVALLKQMKNLSFLELEFLNELTFIFLNMQFTSIKDQEVMEVLDKLEPELQQLLSKLGPHSKRFAKYKNLTSTLRSLAAENENFVTELEIALLSNLKSVILTGNFPQLAQFDRNLRFLEDSVELFASIVPALSLNSLFFKNFEKFSGTILDINDSKKNFEVEICKILEDLLLLKSGKVGDFKISEVNQEKFRMQFELVNDFLEKCRRTLYPSMKHLLNDFVAFEQLITNLSDKFPSSGSGFERSLFSAYKDKLTSHLEIISVRRRLLEMFIKSDSNNLFTEISSSFFSGDFIYSAKSLMSQCLNFLTFISSSTLFNTADSNLALSKIDEIAVQFAKAKFMFYEDDKLKFSEQFDEEWKNLLDFYKLFREAKEKQKITENSRLFEGLNASATSASLGLEKVLNEKCEDFSKRINHWISNSKKRDFDEATRGLIVRYEEVLRLFRKLNAQILDTESETGIDYNLRTTMSELEEKLKAMDLSVLMGPSPNFDDNFSRLLALHLKIEKHVHETGGKDDNQVLKNLGILRSRLLNVREKIGNNFEESNKNAILWNYQDLIDKSLLEFGMLHVNYIDNHNLLKVEAQLKTIDSKLCFRSSEKIFRLLSELKSGFFVGKTKVLEEMFYDIVEPSGFRDSNISVFFEGLVDLKNKLNSRFNSDAFTVAFETNFELLKKIDSLNKSLEDLNFSFSIKEIMEKKDSVIRLLQNIVADSSIFFSDPKVLRKIDEVIAYLTNLNGSFIASNIQISRKLTEVESFLIKMLGRRNLPLFVEKFDQIQSLFDDLNFRIESIENKDVFLFKNLINQREKLLLSRLRNFFFFGIGTIGQLNEELQLLSKLVRDLEFPVKSNNTGNLIYKLYTEIDTELRVYKSFFGDWYNPDPHTSVLESESFFRAKIVNLIEQLSLLVQGAPENYQFSSGSVEDNVLVSLFSRVRRDRYFIKSLVGYKNQEYNYGSLYSSGIVISDLDNLDGFYLSSVSEFSDILSLFSSFEDIDFALSQARPKLFSFDATEISMDFLSLERDSFLSDNDCLDNVYDASNSSFNRALGFFNNDTRDFFEFINGETISLSYLDSIDPHSLLSDIEIEKVKFFDLFLKAWTINDVVDNENNQDLEENLIFRQYTDSFLRLFSYKFPEIVNQDQFSIFIKDYDSALFSYVRQELLPLILKEYSDVDSISRELDFHFLPFNKKVEIITQFFSKIEGWLLENYMRDSDQNDNPYNNIGLNLIPGNYNMFRFNPSRTVDKPSSLLVRNDEFVFTDFDSPENMIATYGSTYLKFFGSKLKTLGVKNQDYSRPRPQFFYFCYINDFFLEKSFHITRKTHIFPETQSQLLVNPVFSGQFYLLALKSIGEQLEIYITLAPVYNILNEFLSRLDRVKHSALISGMDPRFVESALIFLFSYINQCKLTANQSLESGLSEREVLHNLSLQLYKLRVSSLKDYLISEFGHIPNLNLIFRFADNLFAGLLKSNISDYLVKSLKVQAGVPSFAFDLFYGVLNVSDRLHLSKIQKLSNFLHQIDFDTDYIEFDTLFDDFFELEKQQFANPTSLIEFDSAAEFLSQDGVMDFLELGRSTSSDLTDLNFVSSEDINIREDSELDIDNSLEIVGSLISEFLMISRTLKNAVFTDVYYSVARVYHLKFLLSLTSRFEDFLISDFSESGAFLNDLLVEKKNLLSYISFEESKPLMKDREGLPLEFTNIIDNFIYFKDVEVANIFGPQISPRNLYSGDFVDTSLLEKVPKEEEKFSADKFNAFFNNPVEFASDRISAMVINNNNLNNLFPGSDKEYTFYNFRDHFSNSMDKVLRFFTPVANLRKFVTRPIKIYLRPFSNFNMTNFGLVHNPLLWFGHFSESYKFFDDQFHAFQIYKERFNFFSMVVTKNFGSPLFNSVGDRSRSWKTNRRLGDLSGYAQLFSQLQNSSIVGKRQDLAFRESTVKQASQVSKLVGSLPFNYHNTKWILIPDSFSSTLKWFHRDGFRNILPSPLLRLTASDFWVNRRRYARYYFDEFGFFELLKKDPLISFLLKFETVCHKFFFSYGLSDFFFVELKYSFLDFFFVDSFVSRFINLFVPDMLSEFVSLYKFLCLKLLLALSDRWLWLLMGVFKVFLLTSFNFFFDDLFGFFMLYKGNLDVVHSYISLDPGLLRYERKFRKRPPNPARFLLPLNFVSMKGRREVLNSFVFRYGVENWEFYADSIERHKSNVLHKFYGKRRSFGYKILGHIRPFKDAKWPELGLREAQRRQLEKRKLLDIGRVFQNPFEFSSKKYGFAFSSFENIISFQKYTVKPVSVIMQTQDFGNRRSLRRIKQWKYFKPIYLLYNKTNYSFVFQNELLRKSFFPSRSNGISYFNPYLPSSNYRKSSGFNRPHFGETNRIDLLVDHYFSSSLNYPGMPKIEFNREFSIDFLALNNRCSKLPKKSYSVFRHAKPNLSFFPNRLVYHFDLWRANFKDDPFRKTMFYFFAWQWTTGYFREFFIAPFHNNFFMFLGGFYQRYNTPLEEYTSPYWLNFVKLASNGRFSFGSTKSFAYISNSFSTYDRSTIFERFAYDPNFSGQNPYVLNPFKRLSTISGLYDFVDKPGVRQSSLYGKAESFPHRNIFRTTGGVVQLGTPAYKKFHFVKKALYHDVSENKVVGDQKPYDYLDSKIQLPNFTRRRRRRTVFLTISLFFKFVLKVYLVSIDVFFAYYQFCLFCYKQILFLIFLFLLLRFYFYVFKLIIFEYKVRLLIFKNFLISEKLLYLNEINLNQNTRTFGTFSMPDIPYFVRLSPAFVRYRRFLFLHFIINLPKNLVVKSFYEFFRLVKIVIRDFRLDSIGSFFVLFRDIIKLMVNFVFRYFNYYYSILNVLVLRSLKLIFLYYIRILRFYFDCSLPFAFYSYYFSLFFSYSFLLNFLQYLFRVFIFVLVRILVIFLRILRFLFVFLILFFIVGFYSASTGRYISEFSPQFTQWVFIFFLIWIFSSFSKVWSENFLSSGFPEFQPFLEDSGSLEEVYPITEPEFFLPEEDDEDEAQEYEIADVESYDPRFIAFSESRNGIQELDDFPLLPSIDEDVLELLEYEGASLDFSDGDYFNFENEELSRWYTYHSNFFDNLLNLFLATPEQKKNSLLKPGFLKIFYNEDERSIESYKRDPRMFVPFFSYRYSVSVQRFYFYVDALHSLTSLFKRNVFYSNKVRGDQEFLEVYKTYIFPFYRYYGRIFNPYNKDTDQFKSEYEFFFNLDFMSYSKTIDSFSLFSEYVFDEEDEDLWFWEDSDDYHIDPDEDYFEEESDDELEFFVELDDLEEEEDDPEEDGIDFIIPCESLNYSGFISGFSSRMYANHLFDAVSPVHVSSVFIAESFDDNLLIRDSGWFSELLVDRFLIDTSSSYDNSFEGDFLLLSKISQYTDTFVDSNFLTAKSAEFRNFVLAFLKSIACSKIGFMTVKLKRNVGMFSVRSREFISSKDYLDYSEEPDTFIAGPNFYEFDFNSQFFESLNAKRAFFIFYHPYTSSVIGNSLKVVPLLGYEAFNNIYKRRFFKNPLFYINLLNLKNYPDLTLEEAQRLWLYLGCTKDEWDSIDNSVDTKFNSQPFFDSMEFPFLFSLLIFCYSLRVWFRYSILDYRYYSSNEYLFERLFNSWFLDPRQFQKGLDFVYTKQTFNEYYLSSYNYVLFYRSFKSFLCFFHEWIIMFWAFFFHFFSFFMNNENFSVNWDVDWDVLLSAIGIDSVLIDRPVFKYFCLFLSYLGFSFFFKWKGILDVFSVFFKTGYTQLVILFCFLSDYFFSVFYFFFNIDLFFYSWPFFFSFNYYFNFFCIESFLELFKTFLFFFYGDHVYFYAILPLCFLVIFQALGFFTFLSSSFSIIFKFFVTFILFLLQLFIFFDVFFFLLFFEVIKFGYFGSSVSTDSLLCVFFIVFYLFIFLFYKKLKK